MYNVGDLLTLSNTYSFFSLKKQVRTNIVIENKLFSDHQTCSLRVQKNSKQVLKVNEMSALKLNDAQRSTKKFLYLELL